MGVMPLLIDPLANMDADAGGLMLGRGITMEGYEVPCSARQRHGHEGHVAEGTEEVKWLRKQVEWVRCVQMPHDIERPDMSAHYPMADFLIAWQQDGQKQDQVVGRKTHLL